MARALLVVVDSLGIGGAADAGRFGDTGADTFGHILQARAPALPNLRALGLHAAHALAHGRAPATDERADPASTWAAMQERSTGKDTTSGHWEMCGVPVEFDWGYFTAPEHSFPPDLLDALCSRAGLAGVLGNCRASGTEIIERLGREHLASGKPIVYTSADSVLQIAAHEQHFGLERLYATCRIARELVDDYRIARVIARLETIADCADRRPILLQIEAAGDIRALWGLRILDRSRRAELECLREDLTRITAAFEAAVE